ncbi:toxin [Bacillus methanolicus]|uniref:anthrax toxin lethal factor-related metalloendopeptidase n=1 Tax=Bacillus methanolicus TaxID=1471 RepID=UPI002380A66F|nr:toxin [Bacillus methanolicus]MDE3839288.1 toxin [Bacillus methanolicus]
MRKWFRMVSVVSVSLALLGNSPSPIDSIKLKDFSSHSVLKDQLNLQSPDILGDMILLPEGPFDQKEAASIISHIDNLPESMLKKAAQKGISVKLFEGKLTDNPSAQHLRGIIPRGYKNGTTWDEVPGIGGAKTVLVKIGSSEKGKGHGSVNLELHELAHSIDRYVYNEIRYEETFLRIWELERNNLFPGRAYFLTFPEEYFAESFAMYYLGGKYKQELKQKAPATYRFIKNLK